MPDICVINIPYNGLYDKLAVYKANAFLWCAIYRWNALKMLQLARKFLKSTGVFLLREAVRLPIQEQFQGEEHVQSSQFYWINKPDGKPGIRRQRRISLHAKSRKTSRTFPEQESPRNMGKLGFQLSPWQTYILPLKLQPLTSSLKNLSPKCALFSFFLIVPLGFTCYS